MNYATNHDSQCTQLGDLYYATSIFDIPADVDDWPVDFPNITKDQIEIVKRNVHARSTVANNATSAGYKSDAIYHPNLRGFIVERLNNKTYQEKQVDASVVALLVRSAIVNPTDYHAVITGDSDILPAIKVAYPEYTENVFVATSHPDELSAEHRHTSYSIHNFDFKVDAYYLQDHIAEIMYGNNTYNCANCHKVFSTFNEIPRRSRPYCGSCQQLRQQ